jgi:hypothetical protein
MAKAPSIPPSKPFAPGEESESRVTNRLEEACEVDLYPVPYLSKRVGNDRTRIGALIDATHLSPNDLGNLQTYNLSNPSDWDKAALMDYPREGVVLDCKKLGGEQNLEMRIIQSAQDPLLGAVLISDGTLENCIYYGEEYGLDMDITECMAVFSRIHTEESFSQESKRHRKSARDLNAEED